MKSVLTPSPLSFSRLALLGWFVLLPGVHSSPHYAYSLCLGMRLLSKGGGEHPPLDAEAAWQRATKEGRGFCIMPTGFVDARSKDTSTCRRQGPS